MTPLEFFQDVAQVRRRACERGRGKYRARRCWRRMHNARFMHTRGSSALVFLTLRASVNIAFASRSFAEFMRTRAGVKPFCQPGEQGAADISLAGLCSDS